MRNAVIALLLTSAWATEGRPEPQGTEGPVWDLQFIRTKPNQRDAYLLSLAQTSKPVWEEEKRQGLILDYKVYDNLAQHDAQDWDIEIAFEYRNFAGLDGFEAKERQIAARLNGSQPDAVIQKLGAPRVEMREIVATKIIQEIVLK